jgi:hypothetical protein
MSKAVTRSKGAGFVTAVLLVCIVARARSAQAAHRQQATAAATLEQLAFAEFGTLSAAETELLRTAPTRDVAWASPNHDLNAAINDPAKAEKWGPERTVRGELLEWLLSDPQAAKLVHPSGIEIDGARIAGGLDLRYLRITAPLALVDCSVTEGVNLNHGHLASLDLTGSWTGPISGDMSVVDGDVTLRFGHYGEVSFYRAAIGGNLEAGASDFVGDNPLSAVDTTISGDALFHNGFRTGGVVDFRLARIGRSLSFNHARFTGKSVNGLNAERATIAGAIYWVAIMITPQTQLDLSDAHAGALWDDAASWPASGNLLLDGFVYNDFSGGPGDSYSRLAWLRRQPLAMQAQPQPYRQLAEVLRRNGREEGATNIELAREDAVTRFGRMSLAERIWRLALDWIIGYGYRPLRALWWIIGFVILGSFLFRWGYRARLIAPTEEHAYEIFIRTGQPPPHYSPFSSFVYSLENFLPVVNLHLDEYWRPNPRHRTGSGRSFLRFTDETFAARMVRWYLWVHILAGWVITPLLFAGLAGLLHS